MENNKSKNCKQQPSNSSLTSTSATSASEALKRSQGDNNNNTRGEEEETKRTKRRPTKIGLNDTLRRIRHLIIEGRNNLEIQNILQLEERTFYRYMARIYEIDQALFAEQEKKTIITEIGILKDRWLKAYRWCVAMADNENMKPDIRMEAQRGAVNVARALLELEREGPKIIQQGGRRMLEKLYQNSR